MLQRCAGVGGQLVCGGHHLGEEEEEGGEEGREMKRPDYHTFVT